MIDRNYEINVKKKAVEFISNFLYIGNIVIKCFLLNLSIAKNIMESEKTPTKTRPKKKNPNQTHPVKFRIQIVENNSFSCYPYKENNLKFDQPLTVGRKQKKTTSLNSIFKRRLQ